ncbi:MAG: DNA-binding response regulator [Pseudonocardiaceae bacterium]|nr:DNA-binding response regulator [Pseudonocardiaceae bacterium]
MGRVAVHVCALDPISEIGVATTLRPRPEVLLVDEPASAAVTVVVADTVCEQTQELMRRVQGKGCRRIVLVASSVDDAALLAAVEIGVCALIRRADASAEQLAHVATRAASGDGTLPPDMLGRLLDQVGRLQRHVLGPRGLSVTGLSSREARVLGLVADGMDTREIAHTLAYSERTVKNVLHDVTNRFQLRNRSHAVAYALREGLI